MYLESKNKPIIPKKLYKNQIIDYNISFVDELFPHNEESITAFDISQDMSVMLLDNEEI